MEFSKSVSGAKKHREVWAVHDDAKTLILVSFRVHLRGLSLRSRRSVRQTKSEAMPSNRSWVIKPFKIVICGWRRGGFCQIPEPRTRPFSPTVPSIMDLESNKGI